MPRSASLETRAAGGHNINFPNLSIWPSSGVGLLSTQAPKLEQYLTTNGGRWALGSGCFQQVVMESAPKAYAWAAHCSHARAQGRLKPGALSGALLALLSQNRSCIGCMRASGMQASASPYRTAQSVMVADPTLCCPRCAQELDPSQQPLHRWRVHGRQSDRIWPGPAGGAAEH